MTKKQILRTGLFLGTLVSLYFVPWKILIVSFTPTPDTIEEQLAKVHDYGFDGMIVYIDKGGQAAQTYAAGWKNTEKKIHADTNALFKIASIGELYDAFAINKLVRSRLIVIDKTYVVSI